MSDALMNLLNKSDTQLNELTNTIAESQSQLQRTPTPYPNPQETSS
jgi:hypothetical protein